MANNPDNGNKTKAEKNFCMMTGKKQSMEDLVSFPVDYNFKIMGKTTELNIESLLARVEALIEREISRELVRARPSKGGKYTSYSVRVFLRDAEEMTAIYAMLKAENTVVYYL
ncbi:MAG: hypothetical protein DRJ08_05700 [Acidobacteria bacterium]|nr:MAG: hypothetical protein DRJ14_03120 [Acidobacteriota bacterium]RLE21349.1 MAG: hypothetical protein DRJ08_05700 [Acidobacteriota bacterium]